MAYEHSTHVMRTLYVGKIQISFKLERPRTRPKPWRVEEVAKKRNKTMAQVSLAWLLTKEGVTAPIVGTTSLEKLEDLLGAVDVKLSAEDIKYMEEPYKSMNIFM
ncbi:NADP-dependent oxidoreductase domain-containing protein [Mycena sanguinolenta]|nr:NADP-dependent oxidoreductase domain-containing protein [Mycena sanguinolenta]